MPGEKQDGSRIVSVRLPHEIMRRLDRYLDWSAFYRRVPSSRNAAIREALSNWLDAQEQLAGFVEPQAQRQQFQAAYQSLSPHHTWVPIDRLRQLLPWPRERFDAVLEGLRADHHVELDSAAPAEMSDQALQESYQVHGQVYARLRWRGSSGRLPALSQSAGFHTRGEQGHHSVVPSILSIPHSKDCLRLRSLLQGGCILATIGALYYIPSAIACP